MNLFKRYQAAAVTAAAIALILFFFAVVPVSAWDYETLTVGKKGPKVAALRQRLFDLELLPAFTQKDTKYDEQVRLAIQAFETAVGMPITGIADHAVQQKLYSADAAVLVDQQARMKGDLSAESFAFPELSMPPHDEQGFLLKDGTPFIYQDKEKGHWLYVSSALQVKICRCNQPKGKLEWYEARISVKNGKGSMQAVQSNNNGKTFETPVALAKKVNSVLAITDDFYGYRIRYDKLPGMIVRNGEIKSDRTRIHDRHHLQPLEILAQLPNGELRTFASNMYHSEEYVRRGVLNTWAFGPILVQGGVIPRYFYEKDYLSYREPRCAIGMIAPNEYVALLVTGRRDDSRGAYFHWMAEKMLSLGCVEAINLDGGNTVGMVFMGELINKAKGNKSKSIRKVSGVISFGEQ